MVAVTVVDNKTLTRCSTLYCSEAALVSVETLVLPPEMVAESVVDIFQHSADTAAADPGPAQPAQAALGLAAGGLTLLTATLYPRCGLVCSAGRPPPSHPQPGRRRALEVTGRARTRRGAASRAAGVP